ncbi:MAG: rhodanese-like domain-containing protein [Pirellulaceae bacterium]|nr:rhodanese-like domain-containing protein [Pirellulaceae bacterium]
MSQVKTISVGQLAELEARGKVEVVDVRTPAEFGDVHAAMARNVPLDRCDPCEIMRHRSGSCDQPLYVICKSGGRSMKATQKFIDAGFTNVVNVEGGTDAWVAAGLPVVRGKKAVSLERQGRIVAGGLAAAGAFGALLSGNVLWAIIPALMGSGLFLAGITDCCMLGMLLAKMPWNNVQDTGSRCST